MATKFYLHAANSTVSGTLPSSEQNTALTPTRNVDAQTVNRSMNINIGTAQTSFSHATIASTATTTMYFGRFVSEPLEAQTIPSQTWTLNFATSESTVAANFPVNGLNQTIPITCYVWRPSTGAKVGDICNGVSSANVDERTAETSQSCTFSGSSLAIQQGDVLCLEIIFTTTQGDANSRTVQFYYDGTTEQATENNSVSNHASFLNSPGTLTFYTPPTSMDTTATTTYQNKFITKV